jgi:hypothetical protein
MDDVIMRLRANCLFKEDCGELYELITSLRARVEELEQHPIWSSESDQEYLKKIAELKAKNDAKDKRIEKLEAIIEDNKRLKNILCWVRDDMGASGEGTDEAFEMILHGLKGGSADV